MMRLAVGLAVCATAKAAGPQLDHGTLGSVTNAATEVLNSVREADAEVVAWVAKPNSPDIIKYPSPSQKGFHGAHAAGHDAGDDGRPKDLLSLTAVTVNSTGWGPLRNFLLRTDAHLVFGQEHRLPAHEVPAASAWARRRGWRSVWAPATQGPRGGWSAGTVILARSFIGLRHPDHGSRVVSEARAVAAVVEAPSFRPFMAYSVYCHDGQGLGRRNLELCAAIGEHWELQADAALQYLVAADWNMEPHVMGRAGLADAMGGGKIVCTEGLRGTCRTRSRAANYDYFLMSRPMAGVVEKVEVLEATGVRTHTPVLLSFRPRPTSLRSLSIRQPPQLPLQRVFGPLPAPPDWEPMLAAAERLCDATRGGAQTEAAEAALDDLYGMWVDVAEQELMDATGTSLAKEGTRGGGPRVIWRSILPEKRGAGHGDSEAAAWAWAEDLLRDLSTVGPEVRQRKIDLGWPRSYS